MSSLAETLNPRLLTIKTPKYLTESVYSMSFPSRHIGMSESSSTLDLEKNKIFDFFGLNMIPRGLQKSLHIEISFSSADLVGANKQISSANSMIAK